MNNNFKRNYFILRTNSGDAIGLLSLIVPKTSTTMYSFSLHRPDHKDTEGEFLDLMDTTIDFAEFETHRDAFQTHSELEVIEVWNDSTPSTTCVLVQKKLEEKSDDNG